MRPLVQLAPRVEPVHTLHLVAPGPATMQQTHVRRARRDDVESMYRLMERFAQQGLLLPRRIDDVYRNIHEFVVAVGDDDHVLGCGGLRIYTAVLGEIVALAVDERSHGQGIGRTIVQALLEDARRFDLCRVFAMTLQPAFFEKLGFTRQHIALFPEKIAIDCSGCSRRASCTEITMVLDV